MKYDTQEIQILQSKKITANFLNRYAILKDEKPGKTAYDGYGSIPEMLCGKGR